MDTAAMKPCSQIAAENLIFQFIAFLLLPRAGVRGAAASAPPEVVVS
jgi:hypothetical protein